MRKTKTLDRLCIGAVAAMLLATVLLWGCVEPLQGAFGHTLGYEDRLFDQSTVHTIDIVMED